MMSLPYAGQLGGTREYIIAPATMQQRPSAAMLMGTPAKNTTRRAKFNKSVASETAEHTDASNDEPVVVAPAQAGSGRAKHVQAGSGKGKSNPKRHRPLSRKMERRLAEHAKEHSTEHIQRMKADIQSGMTFKRAHARAMAHVGK